MKLISFCIVAVITFSFPNVFSQSATADLIRLLPQDTTPLIIDGIYTSTFGKLMAIYEDEAFLKKNKKINNRIVVDREVNISLSTPDLDSDQYLNLERLHFRKPLTIELKKSSIFLTITDCIFDDGLIIHGQTNNSISIEDNVIKGLVNISQDSEGSFLTIFRNQIKIDEGSEPTGKHGGSNTDETFENAVLDTLKVYGNNVADFVRELHIDFSGSNFYFFENEVISRKRKKSNLTFLQGGSISITDNLWDGPLLLSGDVNDFVFKGNTLSSLISIEKFSFPLHSKIQWNDVLSVLAVIQDTVLLIPDVPIRHAWLFASEDVPKGDTFTGKFYIDYLFDGSDDAAFLRSGPYEDLIFGYKKLFDILKERGDTQHANVCFVKVKELEGRRLSALLDVHGGFKNFFRLRLNRLMRFYTNHATDPAQALVASCYIIICFAIFYFFYPSDWDITSKGRLVSNFKDFIQKNEKGYVKPFFVMLYGFFISSMNALTLSINAFVTLGFGNIPTRGVARYVCILQGFLGWFLLSIFTVALFNQVLF